MGDNILDILENNVLPVYTKQNEFIDTNNGILNEGYLGYNKIRIFKEVTRHLVDELVTTKQHYPVNDVSEVDIEMDFVVIKRSDYNLIKGYLERVIAEVNE